jgi:hypothetical protein
MMTSTDVDHVDLSDLIQSLSDQATKHYSFLEDAEWLADQDVPAREDSDDRDQHEGDRDAEQVDRRS